MIHYLIKLGNDCLITNLYAKSKLLCETKLNRMVLLPLSTQIELDWEKCN